MDFDIRQMQKRMVESQLFDQSATEILLTNFESELSNENLNAENLVHWLCKQKTISPFQADILLAEPIPRLQYGNYQIVDEIDSRKGRYLGRHRRTQHPVVLQFFDGDDTAALVRWQKAKSISLAIQSTSHDYVLKVHEAVSIREYRFIVSAVPTGKKLPDLIPDKARLPVEKAHQIIFQLADGLRHLLQLELPVSLSIDDIAWVSKSGLVAIDYPIADSPVIQTGVLRQLALLWYRIVSGRPPQAEAESAKLPKEELIRLKKYGLQVDEIKLLNQCYSESKEASILLDDVCRQLKVEPIRLTKTDESQEAYFDWLLVDPVVISIPSVDDVPDVVTGDVQTVQIPSDQQIELSGELDHESMNVKRPRTLVTPVVGSVALVVAMLLIVVVVTQQFPVNTSTSVVNKDTEMDVGSSSKTEPIEPFDTTNIAVEAEQPELASFLNQRLINDDQETLWESPTTGPPIDFSAVPASPKIAVSIRLQQLLASESGKAVIKSFGPYVESALDQLSKATQIPLDQLDHLLVTFHSNDDFSYDVFFAVRLASPKNKEELIRLWEAESKQVDDTKYFFKNETSCFGLFENDNQEISRFVFGPETLIQNSVSFMGIDTTTGIMARLVADSDERRHFTVLALRSGIFNDEGQKLMGEDLLLFNQELARSISNVVRGINLSFHLSAGTFIELRIDQSADLTPELLAENIQSLIQRTVKYLSDYTSNMSSNPYWDRVRERVVSIVEDFNDHFRLGVENRAIVGNGWFPNSAAHNWITASHLVLTYGNSQFIEQETDSRPVRSVPQSLVELLAAPRDLSVSTNPDLIILMNNLQQEIKDDYGGLPFEFEIRLMGNDLVKEGITQNQRPSDLDMKQKPLSEILTEIMVKANPDKNITGANDENCKLVWVMAPDPEEPQRNIIMITTRAAAKEKSYELPPAFRTKS